MFNIEPNERIFFCLDDLLSKTFRLLPDYSIFDSFFGAELGFEIWF